MQKAVGIKRDIDKNIYYIQSKVDLSVDDYVVAQFDEFQTIGRVVDKKEMQNDDISNSTKVLRVATESDLKTYNELKEKAKNELVEIKKKSLELGLMMKFVGAEYSLDNTKIIITFSSEERVDFRQFLKELANMLKIRIELKQIGQRDEVKIVGGVGPCGQPCCCSRFLKDFDHVTVKMAKVQGLSLSPTKINGICGRLMCCLGYEAKGYEEILSKMPKVNQEVTCPKGKGKVVYNDIMRERVMVKRTEDGDSFVVEDYSLDEISWEKSQNQNKQRKCPHEHFDNEKNNNENIKSVDNNDYKKDNKKFNHFNKNNKKQ